jgi:ABC-2 type transport system ATP-binding protein
VAKSEAWKNHTTAYIDESFLIGYLTPEEYFDFIASLRQLSTQSLSESLEAFQLFFNDEVLEQKKYIRDLSKGNQKKVGIIASLLGDPELVILDEPFANLDPSSQIQLKRIIQEQAQKKGKTFLISSHDLSHVTEICDRIVLLEKGSPIQDIQTSPSTLKELERYFGA